MRDFRKYKTQGSLEMEIRSLRFDCSSLKDFICDIIGLGEASMGQTQEYSIHSISVLYARPPNAYGLDSVLFLLKLGLFLELELFLELGAYMLVLPMPIKQLFIIEGVQKADCSRFEGSRISNS